ncbi:glycoside hydrolase family 16 protein [Podospora didyma]|uniref:Glycoside hydrolase family 16 protein n=1 Tax=Podospora didyma TaxID=330526 RepID=A0AAE0N9J5_9PEZI|nr:glycoside hydrolase family 16 protein [Podospora didyma]
MTRGGALKKLIMRLPTSLSSFVLLLATTSVPLATAAPSLTQDSQCGCYLTNGTEAGYFSKHQFFDFRNLAQHAGVPAAITDFDENAEAKKTSQYFESPEWKDAWMIGSWNNSVGQRNDSSVKMVNSPNNVYIEANGDPHPASKTWLTLRTQRLADFQTAAEIESVSMRYQFVSMRMLARTVGASGAITAMFTYRGGQNLADVQESDLEVRTMDPRGLIHYTNQPSYTDDGMTKTEATANATMPDGLEWTDWAVHRLDWTPTKTRWYVNDHQVAQISFQTPRDGSKIILNAWSDGGEWTGNMSRNDAAYLQVQWFEILYNSTTEAVAATMSRRREDAHLLPIQRRGQQQDGTCKAVCSIDQTTTQGQPMMLWNNSAQVLTSRGGSLLSLVPWITAMVVFFMSTGFMA